MTDEVQTTKKKGRGKSKTVRTDAVQKRTGWSSEHLREQLAKYKASLLPLAEGEAVGKETAESKKIMEEMLAELRNLSETVIKMIYPGVPDDRFQELLGVALVKCWKYCRFKFDHLLSMDSVSAQLFTCVRNVLSDWWRTDYQHKRRQEALSTMAHVRPRHSFDPVAHAVWHEARDEMNMVMRRKVVHFRLRRLYAPIYIEFVEFYFTEHRAPTARELKQYSKLGADRSIYNAVAYFFIKKMREVTNGQQ